MSRGWYGPPLTWKDAARRAGALLAMGEYLSAAVVHRIAVEMWRRK